MSRLVSILAGLATGIWLTIILGEVTIGAIIGTYVMLFFELPRHSADKRKLRRVISSQYVKLKEASGQIGRLEYEVNIQSQELSSVLAELQRRDSVGAPEARKLIESQRETLQAQARAMKEAQRLIESQERVLSQFENRIGDVNHRWEEMMQTMQHVIGSQSTQAHLAQRKLADESGRLTEAFAEQSREMQRTMSDLLHRLALEPRTSNVSVQDSVLVSGSDNLEHSINLPTISERTERTTPAIPDLHLKARAINNIEDDNWIEAFNPVAA